MHARFPLAAATKQFGSKRVVITDSNGRNQFHGAHIYVMVGREQVTRNTNLKAALGRHCVALDGGKELRGAAGCVAVGLPLRKPCLSDRSRRLRHAGVSCVTCIGRA